MNELYNYEEFFKIIEQYHDKILANTKLEKRDETIILLTNILEEFVEQIGKFANDLEKSFVQNIRNVQNEK